MQISPIHFKNFFNVSAKNNTNFLSSATSKSDVFTQQKQTNFAKISFSGNFGGKLSLFKKLIQFNPQTSLKDAEIFAKKHFKIKIFLIDDLAVANWINEGLTNIKNYTNAKIPKNFLYKNFKEEIYTGIDVKNSIFYINKTFPQKNLSEKINYLKNKNLDNFLLPQQQKKLMQMFTDFTEKQTPYSNLNNILLSQKVDKILDKITLLNKYSEFSDKTFLLDNNSDKFLSIYHEIGHFNHHKKINFFSKKWKKLSFDFNLKNEIQKEAQLNSTYSTTNAKEFVANRYAEMVTKLINFIKENPQISIKKAKHIIENSTSAQTKKLYTNYQGPKL